MKVKLLDDLMKDLVRVTEGRYVNDADDYGDYWVPAKDGRGEPLAALPPRVQAAVLAEEIEWGRYAQRGLTWRQEARIVWNIVDGHPRERWLEGVEALSEHRTSVLGNLLDDIERTLAEGAEYKRGKGGSFHPVGFNWVQLFSQHGFSYCLGQR